MLLARSEDGVLIGAKPKLKATCPMCAEHLIPKCGEIITWHWSHRSETDCDSWYEPESQWHLNWKQFFSDHGARIEVPLRRGEERHRADVVLEQKGKWKQRIIELQATYLSATKIREREAFYGPSLIWIYRISSFADRIVLGRTLDNGRVGFRVKSGPKSLAAHRRPVYFDVGDDGCGCGFWRAFMTVREGFSGTQRLLGSVYHVRSVAGIDVGDSGCDCLQLRYPFCPGDEWETRPDSTPWVREGVFE